MTDLVERRLLMQEAADALEACQANAEKAEAEIERLRREVKALHETIGEIDRQHNDEIERQAAEIERLREQFHYAVRVGQAARDAALEEAAKVADASREKADDDLASERDYDERNRLDTYSWACTQLAAAIRALKEKSR